MRGKVINFSVFVIKLRITPAYAGKSSDTRYHHPGARDHPRLCGEKTFSAACQIVDLGSPPPMRGKVPPVISIAIVIGITPAYAGKSILVVFFGFGSKDHPRLCGEKNVRKSLPAAGGGSPPPMRGKVEISVFHQPVKGITPAYAGKSFCMIRKQ